MKINIKGTEYNIRYTMRALLIFENITSKPVQISTLTDQCTLIYSMLHACNKDCTVSFDDVIDTLDEQPMLLRDVCEMIMKATQLISKDTDTSKKE